MGRDKRGFQTGQKGVAQLRNTWREYRAKLGQSAPVLALRFGATPKTISGKSLPGGTVKRGDVLALRCLLLELALVRLGHDPDSLIAAMPEKAKRRAKGKVTPSATPSVTPKITDRRLRRARELMQERAIARIQRKG